jgi:hypothetical protein
MGPAHIQEGDIFGDIVDLTIWLAMPMRQGGNRPIFPENDTAITRGIIRAWDLLFGKEGNTPPGAWTQCDACKLWHVESS